MADRGWEKVNQLKKDLGVKVLWSWSRFNTYKNDKWEYFLKYVLKMKPDRKNSIYNVSGSVVHSILEKFYKREIQYMDMISLYEDELMLMNIDELKYNRSDSEMNDKTALKYEGCIKHFFQNHVPIKDSNTNEYLIAIKVGDRYFQGHIDFLSILKDDDGNKIIVITDWKTSTIYKNDKVLKEAGQLLLYAEGIRQKLSIPLEQIQIRWNFVKYVIVEYPQANGAIKRRTILRIEIGQSLASNVKMWLKKAGYSDDEVQEYSSQIVLDNSIECLPKDIKDKYSFEDCYVYIPLNENNIESLKKDITITLDEIDDKEKEYMKTKDENVFWQDVTEEDEFRLSLLSGYSRKLHKPYNAYLEEKEMFHTENNRDSEVDDELLELLKQL